MSAPLDIQEFLKLSEIHPVIDVRTPAEYEQGHIVGARNLPLFSNEERAIIGTLYKKEGRQPAIKKGLELVGPRLSYFIEEAGKLNTSGTFLMHCWRGGMRSGSMAWLFRMYGFECLTLKGGYKSYRNHVLKSFEEEKKILVLGGKTGSGKTLILHELEKQGEQTVDLEKLANHKGSSFGSLGEEKQRSQEQFENELSAKLSQVDPKKNCWIENESRKIGVNILPDKLWEQMRKSKVLSIELPVEERVAYLVKEYGKFSKEELMTATERITKHLGGQHAKAAIEAIRNGDLKTACEISLVYYDKTYSFGLEQRPKENIIPFPFDKLDPEEIAKQIRKAKIS